MLFDTYSQDAVFKPQYRQPISLAAEALDEWGA
ncbi:unnamed protein product, partial [Rotaria magnacalcarata]